jgi:rod shape-determining protein MreC
MPKKQSHRSIFFFGAVIPLLIFLHFIKILSPLEAFIFRVLSPIMRYSYLLGDEIKTVYSEQIDKRDLGKAIEEIKAENQRLLVEIAQVKNLEEENKRLKEFINFKDKQNNALLLAGIVSYGNINNNSSEEKIFVVNKGRNDGVREGLAVVNSRGVVFGKIIKVRDSQSVACFSTDKKCQFAVKVLNSVRTIGIARGELGLTIKIDFIPQTEELASGDLVVTSGLEENIPAGLVVGKISGIKKANNDLWQSANIDPTDDFSNISFAAVILPAI